GHDVTVYNRTPARTEPLVAANARAASSPREAVAQADVVFSILTDDSAAETVWLDETTGALQGLRASTIAVECSTVTPAWIQRLGAAADERQVTLLDAPVIGSRPQAEAGQLIFVVGGPASATETILPLLKAMGGAVHHAGQRSAGSWMKLAVNSLFGAQIAVLAELLGMLKKAGITPDQAMSMLSKLPVTSPAAAGVGSLIATQNYAPMFPIDLVEKDFRYALDAAASVDSSLPAVSAVQRVYAKAQEKGHGNENISAVAALYLT
ncbi:MAG: NAD(P)-dependent oxidoreductase, partial [Myxococcota bacterium]